MRFNIIKEKPEDK
jgi:hypothetical protein